jgi:DNA (cytosine-5)-methyltransferase 1
MRYASVCDGIGAAHVAWQPLGWKCSWTSEIEPFPAAVVEHHFGFPNVGDMTKITEEMLDEHGPVDLLVGGTPCQSFSVAGLRGGLADPRGNLALRFVQLAAVMQPKWIVWENVPGVLSSGKGRDFGTFLGALGELGYGFAYRILDAQWFGVAQRRRRVFVVGHLGDWRRAAAVLFERESVFGNPPTRGATGQGSASGFADGSSGGLAKPLGSHALSKGRGTDLDNTTYVAFHPTQDPISSVDGSTHAMGCGSKGGCCTQAVAVAQGFTYSGYSNQPAWMTGDPTDCLPASGHSDGSHQGVGVVAALTASGRGVDRVGESRGQDPVVPVGMAVRRLTPRECERLQGFPDDYTLVEYRKKPAADGPRYRALGNSMAVPVMRWIGQRIKMVDELRSSRTVGYE